MSASTASRRFASAGPVARGGRRYGTQCQTRARRRTWWIAVVEGRRRVGRRRTEASRGNRRVERGGCATNQRPRITEEPGLAKHPGAHRRLAGSGPHVALPRGRDPACAACGGAGRSIPLHMLGYFPQPPFTPRFYSGSTGILLSTQQGHHMYHGCAGLASLDVSGHPLMTSMASLLSGSAKDAIGSQGGGQLGVT